MEDVEPGILAPDPLPEVRGLVAVGVRRIALPEVVAEVERQEPRVTCPSSFVVIATASGSTAKWTSARRPASRSSDHGRCGTA